MTNDVFGKLMGFLNRLNEAEIEFALNQSRDDALMVLVYAPGEYWEIEFLADGTVDVERYRSDGRVDDESVLEELFQAWSEDGARMEATNATTVRD